MKIIHRLAAAYYSWHIARAYPVPRWHFEMYRYHKARSRKPLPHELGKYDLWYAKPPAKPSYGRSYYPKRIGRKWWML